MTTVRDIYDFIDRVAPFNTQAEFDNSGILIGDKSAEIDTVLIALDFTREVLDEAKRLNAQLVITHHPVIFDGLKALISGTLAYETAKACISVISAHTNLDIADNGVNTALLNAIGVKSFDKSNNDAFLRIAEIPKIGSIELIKKISAELNANIQYNSVNKMISKIAVCSGSGSSCFEEAVNSGADAFITGEAKYHDFIKADEENILLISAGHFETETVIVPVLARMIKENFSSLDVLRSKQNTPVNIYKR